MLISFSRIDLARSASEAVERGHCCVSSEHANMSVLTITSRSSTASAGNAASGGIVGGAEDNGTICFDPLAGTEHWKTIFGGHGGLCAADPTDPNVFYAEYV